MPNAILITFYNLDIFLHLIFPEKYRGFQGIVIGGQMMLE